MSKRASQRSVSSPRTVLPNPRRSPRFAGIATFCRYPRLENVTAENKPVDWAIYGVPFDGGVTYRPGARFAPRAIREESQYVKRYSLAHDIDLCDLLSLADAGDAPVAPYSCEENAQVVYEFAMSLPQAAAAAKGAKPSRGAGKQANGPMLTKPFAVGGDHSIAYANIRAAFERAGSPRGGLALLHFDSHLDTVDAVWGERWGHASPFRRAIEAGYVNPKKMLSIGIKGPLNTRDDLDFAREHGVTILTYADISKQASIGAPVQKFVKKLGQAPAYITFDIDCVDPAFAPGTGTPSVGGFTSAQALDLIRACRGVSLVGADIVEVLPDRDHAGITSLLAAHILFEILCLDAVTR